MSLSIQENVKEKNRNKVWIDAWYDPLAASCVLGSCMTLSDINGDNDFKLVVAYSGSNPLQTNNFGSNLTDQVSNKEISLNKLRVFKGESSQGLSLVSFSFMSAHLHIPFPLICRRIQCYQRESAGRRAHCSVLVLH